MTRERINKAVEVIYYAINKNISVAEASVACGYSDTYVKNIKAIVFDKYEDGIIDEELFKVFNDVYEIYNSSRIKPVVGENVKVVGNVGNNVKVDVKGGNVLDVEWTSNSNYPKDHVKTLDELLASAKIDSNVWKVKDYVVNKWDVTSWKLNKPQTIQNWQVKARLEKDVKLSDIIDIDTMFKNMAKNYKPQVYDFSKLNNKTSDENNLLEISIFDLHIGKLAWGGETFENYDTKIATERFLTAIKNLLQRARGFEYSKILFPVGNDFFNSDTILNTTTKGTQQDEDLRWQKTFSVGVKLLVDGINLLKQTGVPVDVIVIPGNHDFERSYYMGKFLEAWFNNDPMVNVNNGASPRKYYRFGNLLLGLTHGSEEKESSLPMLMASDIESKPMWSETKFHEWHLGHQHRKKNVKYGTNHSNELNEDLGVTVRYLSSLTGTEEWHHKKGFVGCIKAADGFIWNDEFGLLAHLNTNIIIN